MIINISQPNNIKNYIDKECQHFTFNITQTPSLITEDTSATSGFIFTLYSKNRSDIAFIDRNLGYPTSILDGEIFGILYGIGAQPQNDYIREFNFKPKKDEITRIGYTNFNIISSVEFNTIEPTNDLSSIFGANYPYIAIFAVHDYTTQNNNYRFFRRKSNSGTNFSSSFEEVELNYFKNIRNKITDVVQLNNPTRTVVYKCRIEKCIMKAIQKVNESNEPEKYICKCSECKKGFSITELMQAYQLLLYIDAFSGMFSSLVYEIYTEQQWIDSNKLFNILEVLNCCNCACGDC